MISCSIDIGLDYTDNDIIASVCSLCKIGKEDILSFKILKRTLNKKDIKDIKYKMTVGLNLSPLYEARLLKIKKRFSKCEELTLKVEKSQFKKRPVVVGAGPAGLFAALILAESGARPILIERGQLVEDREKTVKAFMKGGKLNTECNIQFGEGGAGAFSDGKLKSGLIDANKYKVLSEFVSFGAPEDILYETNAHIGTDKLPGVISGIREKIKSLGAEVYHSTRLTDIDIKDGRVVGINAVKENKEEYIETDTLVLATGHSARDVYRMLYYKGIEMQAHPFGIGMRIEHKREYINELEYGKNYNKSLPTASYHYVSHLENGRSVYSFCMCPGGTVVAATSEEGAVVTNGMSTFLRDGENSNSAILVSVFPSDFLDDTPLGGILLQEKIEAAAFKAAGGNYSAPVILLKDLLENKESDSLSCVTPTYQRGYKTVHPVEYLPEYIVESLKAGIRDFDLYKNGFIQNDAVLTGPETRSTSPIRILRDEHSQSVSALGLYPIGEGAGYGGGILSSAVDGIKCALNLIKIHKIDIV